MLTVTQEHRHEVANRLWNSPAAKLDPASPLLALEGFCPLCGGDVVLLRNDLSLREYLISGMCQKCQDATFGSEDGEAVEVATDPVDFVDLEDIHWNELD